jgi:hypothetical protein
VVPCARKETMSTESLLQAILDELKTARLTPPPVPLGFGSAPKARFIYANRQYSDCLWYFWNGSKNEHEPIEHTAITGYLEKLELEEKVFRKKAEIKVNLTIRADRLYIIQAGFDTLFARGLLHTLAKLPGEAFRHPIMIGVEPGETEQVLFCRIYNPATGKSVIAQYPDDTDWHATAQRAIAKIQKVQESASDQA